MSDCYIRIKGDVLVGVPAQLLCLTTWVLFEQEDWFENEIRFVRRWLRPGMRVIDIGANLGVYALTMAKLVAPSGQVWAFEPTSESAAALSRNIARNGFANVRLMQMALSDRDGKAALHRQGHSELNSLVAGQGPATFGVEMVTVSSLDRQQAALGWGTIDFIKIDAEGSGLNILAGGAGFFAAQSPLVMFEAADAHSGADQTALPAAFRRLGYEVYRLVGPDSVLAPVAEQDQLTGFDLNLFACKQGRAAQLAAAGLLVQAPEPAAIPLGGGRALFERQAYARVFRPVGEPAGRYREALDAYGFWRGETAPLAQRYAALRAAFVAAQGAVEEKGSIARVATLGRIAFEAGERQCAIDLMRRAIPMLGAAAAPDEPFFPPVARYDAIDPAGMSQAWLFATIFEAFETWEYFSGCFKTVDRQNLPLLDRLQSSPFASAPMERRRQMQRWLAGLQPGIQVMPILSKASPDHLNPALWMPPGA